MQYGAFITREDFDVTKQQNIANYILNSNKNTFKIYKRIIGSLSVALNGDAEGNFVHGLQYHPAFLAYYRLKQSSGSFWLDQTAMNNTVPDNDDFSCETYINAEKIIFKAADTASRGPTVIEYRGFLFVDPISLVGPSVTGVPLTSGIGFKVSKPGVSVLTAKAHELLVSSKYEALKFHMERTVALTVGAADTSKEVSFQHGLGYIPMFTGVTVNSDDTSKLSMIPYGRSPQPYASSVRADKSTITVSLITSGGTSFTDRFKVTVFKNKLADA